MKNLNQNKTFYTTFTDRFFCDRNYTGLLNNTDTVVHTKEEIRI